MGEKAEYSGFKVSAYSEEYGDVFLFEGVEWDGGLGL